jgi:CRISPR-associated endonuclease/helicase Cas3
LSVLQVKHGFVRLFGLADKVVILDEVHAYDTYTSSIIDRLIEWLAVMGSSVILLSATLPRHRVNELMRLYAGPNTEVSIQQEYPRVSWITRGGTPTSIPIGARPQKPVRLRRVGHDPSVVAKDLVTEISHGEGCAAWICNTVGKAQEVYQILRPMCRDVDVELSLLHSRFPFEKRKELENRCLDDFGKASLKDRSDPEYRPRPKRSILVATQIVEQSLDLDFDLLVTHMPPVDLLLQRIGRLHRHDTRPRPYFVDPTVWLVEATTTEDGLPDFGVDVRIYSEYVLLRTWLSLAGRRSIGIPSDIEQLMHEVYESDGPTGLGAGPIYERLEQARAAAEKQRCDDEAKAGNYIVRKPDDSESIVGEYNANLNEDEDPRTSQIIQAATRLGLPSIQVVCLYDAGNGDISLDRNGREIVSLSNEPDAETTKRLLNRSVTLTHQGVRSLLVDWDPPVGWRKSRYLRYHRAIVFRQDRCMVGEWEVRLDDNLGIVIQR